jgi:hypothetical protein
VTLLAQQVLTDKDSTRGALAHRYLSFLQQAFNEENGRFRNFMSYDRRWQEEEGSEDSHGRALWALGQTVLDSPLQGMAAAAMALFERALPRAMELENVRSCAYAILGVDAYLRRFGGATEVRRALTVLAERLHEAFTLHARPDWPWPEDMLTYANGLLPHALIAAGVRLGREDMQETGLTALEWLVRLQTDPKGHFVPVGNRGWYSRNGTQARFDQQPIEVEHMADAALEAFRATGDQRWLDEARRCFEWFLGRNDLGQPVCDHTSGGCRDGLQAEGLNQNQGAESTLAWLHSLLAMHIATGAAEIAVRDIATARRPATAVSTPAPRRPVQPERVANAPSANA